MKRRLIVLLGLVIAATGTSAEESSRPPSAGARPEIPGSDSPVKRLDETNIEGEIRLPQVLFITSRDSDRPLDFLELYRAMTSLEIGREAPLPNRIHVVRREQLEGDDPAADPGKSADPAADPDVLEEDPESTPKEESP